MGRNYRLHRIVRQVALIVSCLVISMASVSVFTSQPVRAGNFTMQTGYYVGNGTAGHAISGLGFQPNLVFIKAAATTSAMAFKTSAMPASTTSFLSSTADNTASQVTLNADGFTLGATLANVNAANVLFHWIAFGGSDCTSTGTFCVGSYSGNAAASRAITTNFSTNLAIVKRSTNVAGHFRTSSMPANTTEYFSTAASDTAGNFIADLTSTGFTVGASDNASGGSGNYHFIAFKSAPNLFTEGTYTGNGADNRNITGVGFQPSAVFIKNSASATTNNRRSVFATPDIQGDGAHYVADSVAGNTNMIQGLQSDGFQLGSSAVTNESGLNFYWFAFTGAAALPAGSGTFTMANGSYTGNGTAQTITTSFKPDLIIIKAEAAEFAVFRTSLVAGDTTTYLGREATSFSGGITSLSSSGFSVGTSTATNTTGTTYHWQAFGNAYNPETRTGSSDFAIGVYHGNSSNNRAINTYGISLDFVAVKQNGTNGTVFRTSSYSDTNAGSFAPSSGDAANRIPGLGSGTFTIGTAGQVNSNNGLYAWFGFKNGANFAADSYTGDGTDDRSVQIGSGFRPSFIIVKRNTQTGDSMMRPDTLSGDATQYINNTANVSGVIKSFNGTGMTLGASADSNASGGIYRYMAWRVPSAPSLGVDIVNNSGDSVVSPNIVMSSVPYLYTCTLSSGTLGASTQKIRVSNTTNTPGWSLSIAATGGANALWQNSGNTAQYDYNDDTGSPSGCSDGVDGDSVAGKLRVLPSGSTITPSSSCSTSGISRGSDNDFNAETSAITLLSASGSAQTSCYWDITGIGLEQRIPAHQLGDNYTLNLTLTSTSL
jgi:hypothetical protein